MEFDEDAATAEDASETVEHLAGLLCDGWAVALAIDGGGWTFVAAGETDEAGGVGGEFFVCGEGEFRFAGLGGDVAELCASDEAAEVLIAFAVFGEEGEAVGGWVGLLERRVDFGTDEGADVVFDLVGTADSMRASCAQGDFVVSSWSSASVHSRGDFLFQKPVAPQARARPNSGTKKKQRRVILH